MRTRLVGIAAVLLAIGSGPASAHAILVESTPAIGAGFTAGEVALRLRFNSRIDRARSRLTLMLPDHSTQVLPITNAGADDLLLSTAQLPAGPCVVRWQVLAVDGHITRGDIPLIGQIAK